MKKKGEPFDGYLQAILQLEDRLSKSFAHDELLEVLRGGMSIPLRRALLRQHLSIVAQLGQAARELEFLDREERLMGKFGTSGSPNISLHPSSRLALSPIVSEVSSDSEFTPSNVEEVDNQLKAISPPPLCWNCRVPGHRWDLCRAPQRVFYCGYGAPDTYKPDFTTCASKNGQKEGTLSPVSSHRQVDGSPRT